MASEMGVPIGHAGQLVDVARLSSVEQQAMDALPEASRVEALALFQELSTGLFAVHELLAQYREEVSRAGGALEGAAPGLTRASSTYVTAVDVKLVELTASPVVTADGATPSQYGSAGSAALDRARRANEKPPSGVEAELMAKVRVAEAAIEESRAALKYERAGRLAAEAKLREMGAEVPEFHGASSSDSLTIDGQLEALKLGSGGEASSKQNFVQNAVAGAMGALSSILPKPEGKGSPRSGAAGIE